MNKKKENQFDLIATSNTQDVSSSHRSIRTKKDSRNQLENQKNPPSDDIKKNTDTIPLGNFNSSNNNSQKTLVPKDKEENAKDTNEPKKETLLKGNKTSYGKFLLIFVLMAITEQYISFIFLIEYANFKPNKITFPIIRLIIFNLLFILLISSMRLTIKTNPGIVPLYWGFYIGDEDFKKRRYCLVCQLFKPERTHHCSICSRCVLNMDHHCPWINTCIGFYNRKFFIQLIIYTFFISLFISVVYIPFTYDACVQLYKKRHSYDLLLIGKSFLIIFNNLIMIILFYYDTKFMIFHLDLALSNKTTIETLDEELTKKNKYNINKKENWEQVFGIDPLYWFLPIYNEKGFPKGDGLTWVMRENKIDVKKELRTIWKSLDFFNNKNLNSNSTGFQTPPSNIDSLSNTHFQKDKTKEIELGNIDSMK